MKYAFAITSAVNSKFGSIPVAQRMEETLETIKSIKTCVPDADTYLIDMCGDPLTDTQKATLATEVTQISDYSSDPEVQKFYQIPSQDIVKNLTEMVCFGNFLSRDKPSQVREENWTDYDRVFKISGRYKLNPNVFRIQDYQVGFPGMKHPELINKMVFSGVYNSQFDPKITDGLKFQFMSRLWSFDPTLLPVIRTAYTNMVTHMIDRLNNGGYVDIEHLLFKHMPPEHCVIKTPVGLTGGIAPNGMIVND